MGAPAQVVNGSTEVSGKATHMAGTPQPSPPQAQAIPEPYKVGILVPPENPTVEPEMHALLPPSINLFTTRLPVVQGDLRDRLLAYNDAVAASVASFGGMRLDAAYLACTGSSYLVGAGDVKLDEALGASGAEPLTAARAIVETLVHVGRARIMILSPYPDWLTRLAVAYWEAHGIEVASVAKVQGGSGIYGLTTDQVVAHLRALPRDDGAAVLMSGTGMATVEAAVHIGRDLEVPILSSAIASAASLARRSGAPHGLARDLVSAWE